MTVRLIVCIDDAAMAANVGGSVHTSYRTFDVDLPDVEALLRDRANGYTEARLIGCELVDK